MFYITSRGHAATGWLSQALSIHPNIVCWHGTRSIPPYSAGHEKDLSEEEFVKGLAQCELLKNGANTGMKKFGACHGFYGTKLLKYINKYNGTFLAITRNPITNIHSHFSEFLTTTHAKSQKNILYKFNINDLYKDHYKKINTNFNKIINLKNERKEKKEIFFDNLKNLKLYLPLRKFYRFAKKKEKSFSIDNKKININKLIKNFGSDYVIENVILNFVNHCNILFDTTEEIYKKIGFRDFISMEKMTVSSSYFNNQIFKKIMNRNAEKEYLLKIYKILPSHRHSFKVMGPEEIYNAWPKTFKDYFSKMYEKNKAKKMFAMMNYKIEKII